MKVTYLAYASAIDRKIIRRLACQFFLSCDVLYKRSYDNVLLRCVGDEIMSVVYEGAYGSHMSGHVFACNILKMG